MPRLLPVLQRQSGFRSVQHILAVDGAGDMVEVTTWDSPEACRNYVRNGAAALVATLSDALLPTADHPHGTWMRQTHDVP